MHTVFLIVILVLVLKIINWVLRIIIHQIMGVVPNVISRVHIVLILRVSTEPVVFLILGVHRLEMVL